MEPVEVLWTSGWDSTFRVADLLLNHDAIVRPWYVMDEYRRSTAKEMATQNVIRGALASLDPTTARRLLPAQVVKRNEIPSFPAISEAFKALLRKQFLGEQYEWLARLAEDQQLTLELSIHRDDRAHEALARDIEKTDGSHQLVANPSDPALEVFRRFRFPLFETTKLHMETAARGGGFYEVMELTWFCHTPIRGRPCGCCNPCRYTRDEGLGRRVPPLTRGRQFQAGVADAVWTLRLASRRWH